MDDAMDVLGGERETDAWSGWFARSLALLLVLTFLLWQRARALRSLRVLHTPILSLMSSKRATLAQGLYPSS